MFTNSLNSFSFYASDQISNLFTEGLYWLLLQEALFSGLLSIVLSAWIKKISCICTAKNTVLYDIEDTLFVYVASDTLC